MNPRDHGQPGVPCEPLLGAEGVCRDELTIALSADPALSISVADTVLYILVLAKLPPADLAVVVAPAILYKINFVWIELLATVERHATTTTMNQCRSSPPHPALP